jgi:hypothetical protein
MANDSPTREVDKIAYRYNFFKSLNKYLREAKIETARHVVSGTYVEPIYAKTSENRPHCHVSLSDSVPKDALLIRRVVKNCDQNRARYYTGTVAHRIHRVYFFCENREKKELCFVLQLTY